MKNYTGILFIGQSTENTGRGIAPYRLRTAARKAGFDILIVDSCARLKAAEIFSIIEKYKNVIKFVGFSSSWIAGSTKDSFKWFVPEFFKELDRAYPDIVVITGGHALGTATEPVIPYSKYHFHGFSDNSFVEFLKFIEGKPYNLVFGEKKLPNGKVINGNRDYPVKPDDIETIFEKSDGFLPHQPVPIEISRGCIFRCAYCHHPFQGASDYDSYIRTPESIARELKRNYELFGTTRYTITDDTFNDSIEKLERVKRAVELSGIPKFEFVGYIRPDIIAVKPQMIDMLVDLGLKGAFFGVESMNQAARKAVGKGTHIDKIIDVGHKLASKGVLIHAGMIVGLPGDTEETIRKAQEYFLSGQSPFRFWLWAGLFLKNDKFNFDDSKSTLDKQPGKYGYIFLKPEAEIRSSEWKNEHFTDSSAYNMAQELNEASFKGFRFSGWRLAGAWQLNRSEEQIQNEVISLLDFNAESTRHERARALEQLKTILEE